METFIVSFGTCTLTALMVMLSGVVDWSLPLAERATSTAAVGAGVRFRDAGSAATCWRSACSSSATAR